MSLVGLYTAQKILLENTKCQKLNTHKKTTQ